MVARMTAVALVMAIAGCAGPTALSREALVHDERAQEYAEKGQGARAVYETNRADGLRATAQLRANSGGWFRSDVLLR
jgi:hypothetical protein